MPAPAVCRRAVRVAAGLMVVQIPVDLSDTGDWRRSKLGWVRLWRRRRGGMGGATCKWESKTARPGGGHCEIRAACGASGRLSAPVEDSLPP